MRLIYKNRPYLIFLENSSHLITFRSGAFVGAVLHSLRAWGYVCQARKVNTALWGLPHFRERVYIVGVHRDVSMAPFDWPKHIPPMQVSDLLAPVDEKVGPNPPEDHLGPTA